MAHALTTYQHDAPSSAKPLALHFHLRNLWMYPASVGFIRLQELARKAMNMHTPSSLIAVDSMSRSEARTSFHHALSAALGQILVYPVAAQVDMLQRLSEFVSFSKSLDGVAPVFLSCWSMALHAGTVAPCWVAAALWDEHAHHLRHPSHTFPVLDSRSNAVLFYRSSSLRRLRLTAVLQQHISLLAAAGGMTDGNLPGFAYPGGAADPRGNNAPLGISGLSGGGNTAFGNGGNASLSQVVGSLGSDRGQGGLGGSGFGGSGFNVPSGSGFNVPGGGSGFNVPGGGSGFNVPGGGSGFNVPGGGSGFNVPGGGFGGSGLQPGDSEDGDGSLCQGIVTYGGALLGAKVGADAGAAGGALAGDGLGAFPGAIGGAMGGYEFGKDVGHDLASVVCGGSSPAPTSSDTATPDTGYENDQLLPGTYTDEETGLEYTVTGDGHTVSGDTSTSGTVTDLGDIDQPPATDDTPTPAGGEKPDPEGSGGEKPNPDGSGTEKPNPESNGPSHSGTGEKPNPDSSGSGTPHSRGASLALTATYATGTAVAASAVRVSASRYQLYSVPSLRISTEGALSVARMGFLAAQGSIGGS